MATSVLITRTTPVYNTLPHSGVFVQWQLNEPVDGVTYTYRVEVSESQGGAWDLVAEGLTGYHTFDGHRDATDLGEEARNFLSLQRKTYYRVTAIPSVGSPTSDIKIVGDELPRRQWLLKRKILRDITVGFKFNSVPLALLKRKHKGARCTVCFDKLSKMVTNSRCPECLGTGFTTGYYDPVYYSARKGVTNITTTLAPQGRVEVNQMELTVLDYPSIEVDDVIVETRQNRRYIVKHVTRTELRGVPVHQRLVMSELARDSVEYRIRVQPGVTPAIY